MHAVAIVAGPRGRPIDAIASPAAAEPLCARSRPMIPVQSVSDASPPK